VAENLIIWLGVKISKSACTKREFNVAITKIKVSYESKRKLKEVDRDNFTGPALQNVAFRR